MWGRIVQILMDSGTMNPVIYFDELDKVSGTPRGEEIINLLIHLTDTSQNTQFQDKYFSEIDFNVSRCLFIFSYNDEGKVSPVLLDRMNRVCAKGYSGSEKRIIAQRYLLPNTRAQFGFSEGDIILSDAVVDYIVGAPRFTQGEEGVRNMKRCLEKIHARLNLRRLLRHGGGTSNGVEFPYRITCSDVDACVPAEGSGHRPLSMYV
jgi:ATP-dependent Lon protease